MQHCLLISSIFPNQKRYKKTTFYQVSGIYISKKEDPSCQVLDPQNLENMERQKKKKKKSPCREQIAVGQTSTQIPFYLSPTKLPAYSVCPLLKLNGLKRSRFSIEKSLFQEQALPTPCKMRPSQQNSKDLAMQAQANLL